MPLFLRRLKENVERYQVVNAQGYGVGTIQHEEEVRFWAKKLGGGGVVSRGGFGSTPLANIPREGPSNGRPS